MFNNNLSGEEAKERDTFPRPCGGSDRQTGKGLAGATPFEGLAGWDVGIPERTCNPAGG